MPHSAHGLPEAGNMTTVHVLSGVGCCAPGVDIIVTTLPRWGWGGGGGLLSQEAVMTE